MKRIYTLGFKISIVFLKMIDFLIDRIGFYDQKKSSNQGGFFPLIYTFYMNQYYIDDNFIRFTFLFYPELGPPLRF